MFDTNLRFNKQNEAKRYLGLLGYISEIASSVGCITFKQYSVISEQLTKIFSSLNNWMK